MSRVLESNTETKSVTVSQPAQGAGSIMAIIEKASMSPDFDVAKLAQLLDVKERWDATEARKAYSEAMAKFKANPPRLVKNKHVKFGNTEYNHATLGNVCDVIGNALAAVGISHSWETHQEGSLVSVSCVLSHVMGHSVKTTLSAAPDTSGSKNSIQAVGSTVTYLQRYTLLAATGMATEEQDDDSVAAGRPEKALASPVQIASIKSAAKVAGVSEESVCKKAGIESLEQMPAEWVQPLIDSLKKRAAQ